MPRRHGSGPSKSLFASLPTDLRQTLRSKRYEFVDPSIPTAGGGPSSFSGTVSLDVAPNGLLGTQPVSEDGVESEDEHVAGPSVSATDFGETRNISRPGSALRESPIPSKTSTLTPLKRPLPTPFTPDSAAGTVSAKKRGKRRAQQTDLVGNPFEGHRWDCTGLVQRYTRYDEVPPDIVKYFGQRHLLFPQYDNLPLLLDRTGWFSVTPQSIAAHIAERCACDLVVDAFCGVGGNAIEFARTCERVIAIDNDPIRLRLARHNALHHGVADRIEFILGDYTDFARSFALRNTGETVDVVFLSPPWGGIDYLSTSAPTYPLSAILPVSGSDLFELTSLLTPNIAYYLPRNVDMHEVAALAQNLSSNEVDSSLVDGRKKEWVEVEEQWVGDKLKAVTAYYGGLVADA